MLSVERIKEIADAILHAKLDSYGYSGVDVREGLNQENEEALFIVGRMRPNAEVPPGRVTTQAISALSNALLNEQEARFPYVSLTREGEERADAGPAPWEH
jgi:hypothetical protein